ncbi:MAG: hypothetical protein ACOYNR_02785 [Blastocatellia bacterium]|jgi:multidrug efflux pump subunit AcrB
MILLLLLVTLILSLGVSWLVARLFGPSIESILRRIIDDEISLVWSKYLRFAILVVGVSNGVRVWDYEKYLNQNKEGTVVALTTERWIFELYHTVISALQGIAWLLLVFFVFALLAYVVVRAFDLRQGLRQGKSPTAPSD